MVGATKSPTSWLRAVPQVWQALAAVLHMSNLSFDKVDNEQGEIAAISDRAVSEANVSRLCPSRSPEKKCCTCAWTHICDLRDFSFLFLFAVLEIRSTLFPKVQQYPFLSFLFCLLPLAGKALSRSVERKPRAFPRASRRHRHRHRHNQRR